MGDWAARLRATLRFKATLIWSSQSRGHHPEGTVHDEPQPPPRLLPGGAARAAPALELLRACARAQRPALFRGAERWRAASAPLEEVRRLPQPG